MGEGLLGTVNSVRQDREAKDIQEGWAEETSVRGRPLAVPQLDAERSGFDVGGEEKTCGAGKGPGGKDED